MIDKGNLILQLQHFAEEHFTSKTSGNNARLEELLSWIENLENDPHDEDCPCYIGLEEAKQIVQMIREQENL